MRTSLFRHLRTLSNRAIGRSVSILVVGIVSGPFIFQYTAIAQTSAEEKVEQKIEDDDSALDEIVGDDIDPTTIRHVTIPRGDLAVLVKPMTLEEIKIESKGWFLLLKHVAFRVSQTEFAIRLENRATQELSQGQKLLESGKIQLEKAGSDLLNAEPNTIEYRTAAEELELAKEKIFEAKKEIFSALKTIRKFQSDPWLKAEIDQAKLAEAVSTVREVYDKTIAERAITPPNSEEHEQLSEVLIFFEKSFAILETLQEEIQDKIPETKDYNKAAIAIGSLQSNLIHRAHILSASGLVPLQEERSFFRTASGTFRVRALNRIEKKIQEVEDTIRQQQTAQDYIDQEVIKKLDNIIEELDAVEFSQQDLNIRLLANSLKLKGKEVSIIDRFEVILNALDAKGGNSERYRLYISTVSRIEFDIFDTEALQIRLVSWLKSEEGGQRVSLNILKFVALLSAALVTAQILARVTEHFLDNIDGVSELLREFIVVIVKRGVLIVGLMVALTSLGISLGPVLALFGGVSFVLAFALQSNLGNFASGLMLLINKPFDVGDRIQVAGYIAFVEAISLANTKLRDSSGCIITLPNNTVWGGEITNYTNSEKRRLSFKIYVKFDEDIIRIKQMWTEIAGQHPEVLEFPPPGISCPINAHYQNSIRVSLKAWCFTPRSKKVYFSLLQTLQGKMKELNIELAAPAQRVIVENDTTQEEYLLPGKIQLEKTQDMDDE